MRPSLIKAIACSNWPMNVALPIVSHLVQIWVDSRKDGSKTTEIPFINDHRRTFTLIFHLNATVSFDAIDAKYFERTCFG